MKITTGITEEGLFRIVMETPLLKTYYSNLVGMIKNDSSIPQTIGIERGGEQEIILTIQLDPSGIVSKENNGMLKVTESMVAPAQPLLDLCKRFAACAIHYKLKHIEFIPLEGYPIDKLKEDVKAAVGGKRNFMFLDTYKTYLEDVSGKEPTYDYWQHEVQYGTNEYTDIALQILRGDLSGIRKVYKAKLTKQCWI